MPIKKGDKVTVNYTGRLADGSVFDTSKDHGPLEFVMGKGQLIPGFEAAVAGRQAGDKITVTIPPADAYGARDPELVFTVSRAQVPDHIPLTTGTPIQLSNAEGQLNAIITEVGADELTLDANHPLAGKELIFDIEIVDVKPAE